MFSTPQDAAPFVYTATVPSLTHVYDGDTITRATIDLGFHIYATQTLRLYGINTPELRGDSRAAGLVSRDYLRGLITPNMSFLIRTHRGQGKYGRWLAEIFIDGKNVNYEMIKLGLAIKY